MFNLVKSVDSIIADFKNKIDQLDKAAAYHRSQASQREVEAKTLMEESVAQSAEAERAARLMVRLSALVD